MWKVVVICMLSFVLLPLQAQTSVKNETYFVSVSGNSSEETVAIMKYDSMKVSATTVSTFHVRMKQATVEHGIGFFDYNKAIAKENWKENGITYSRELISIFNTKLVAMHISASKKASLSLQISGSVPETYWVDCVGGLIEPCDSGFVISNANEVIAYFSPEKIPTQNGYFADKPVFRQVLQKQTGEYQDMYEAKELRLPKKEAKTLLVYNQAVNQEAMRKLSSGYWNGIFVSATDTISSAKHFDLFYASKQKKLIVEKIIRFSDGFIDVLPALDSNWMEKGRILNVETKAGFFVDLSWEDSALKTLVIKSKQGGNCRLRVHTEIDACKCLGLKPAVGDNPNKAFETEEGTVPIKPISCVICQTYDFDTYPGEHYVILGK